MDVNFMNENSEPGWNPKSEQVWPKYLSLHSSVLLYEGLMGFLEKKVTSDVYYRQGTWDAVK